MNKDDPQPGRKRVVANEQQLRTALKQQLLHNEQQNLVMTKMSASLGRAGRLVTSFNKNLGKVDSGAMSPEDFINEVKDLLSKFDKTNQRGSKTAPKRG